MSPRTTPSPTEPTRSTFTGATGEEIVLWRWSAASPRFVTVIVHGYGEHARRYDHVASRLLTEGSVVFAHDQFGHGRSGGARVVMADFDDFARDLDTVIGMARQQNGGLPVVVIGHSLGGAVATRFVQRGGGVKVDALVLSGPYVGGNPELAALALHDPIPDIPLDPAGLSRDPLLAARYAAEELVYHGPFLKDTLLVIGNALAEIASGPDFGDLPTIWLHGGDDPVAPYANAEPVVLRLIGSEGRRIRYEGARHEIFNEINRADVLDDVVAFLRESLSV